ncbi:MAG: carboxypeptidase-like regulatory domain-containing protein, partial [Gammaproteobacteria bacterium]|nr:carboxypeptidase-like regulatory domain-containing protein [Gammaproteobacteria bacterium]
MNIQSLWRSLLLAALTLVSAQALAVGEGTGNIVGTLENQTSGSYTVNAKDESTGRTRDVSVNAEGGFRFSQLPVGSYVLSVSRDGTVVARDTFAVTLNGTTTARFPLIEQVSMDEITVTASAPSYDTYSTDSGLVLG